MKGDTCDHLWIYLCRICKLSAQATLLPPQLPIPLKVLEL